MRVQVLFQNPKCAAGTRAALARAYRSLLSALSTRMTEAELVGCAGLVLSLAVAAPGRGGAGGGSVVQPLGGGGRWCGAVMEDDRQVWT